MAEPKPTVIVLAEPNGAGKTTASRLLLAETLHLLTFVNADVIAQGLAGFAPDSVALEASRIMLDRLHKLAEQRSDFAFETTLAARTYAPWLRTLRQSNYQVHLNYFWLDSADLAVRRVSLRVQQGGHNVPEVTIRQRYRRSVRNFFDIYRPIVSTWRVYDNSQSDQPELIAFADEAGNETIARADVWDRMRKESYP